MIANENRRKRRGSALLMTYFAAVVLSFVIVYGYRSSLDAGNVSQAVATTEKADYAAEYGANLALSQLTNLVKNPSDRSEILRDWVEDGIYNSSQTKGRDQRRIGGAYEGYNFRVQVRSANLALANGTMPSSWLDPTIDRSTSGNERKFNNSYEILATARKSEFGEGAQYNANDAYTAKVYGVVDMAFGDNPIDDTDDSLLQYDNLGKVVYAGGGSSVTMPPSSLTVDGEDHDLKTVFPVLPISSQKKVVGAQRGVISDGKFVAATGGYWNSGNLTLNFLADDRSVDPDSIRAATTNRAAYTPVRPNPHVPLTREINHGDNSAADRKMTSKWYQFQQKGYPSGFYDRGQYKNSKPKPEDRLTKENIPVDQYFLGGKQYSGKGRTVNFTRDDMYDAYNVMDSNLYIAAIKETHGSQLAAAKALDVIVGSYEELKRFYITHVVAGDNPDGWRATFVGEWTDGKYRPGNSSTPDNMLFDNNTGVARRRSFSKHYPMNKDGKILVHEMLMYDKNSKTTREPKSWEVPKVWTGRYKWVEPDFNGKFWVKDKATGLKVYPREFTWEEVTGMKTKRMPSSSERGEQVAGMTFQGEVDENGDLVAFDDIASNVWIEGYPICDTIGREIPELDAENKPIPIGLTEYCSVNKNDHRELIPANFTDTTGIDKWGVPDVLKKTGKQKDLTAYKNKERMFAKRNFIEVVEDDGSIRYYDDITDFEFRNTVTIKDDAGNEIAEERNMASIIVGIEDLPESSSDFDYTDMMFILNVVPPTDGEPVLLGSDNESAKYIQWWELDPDMGLTGGESQTPISSTEHPTTGNATEWERAQNNFEYLLNGNIIDAKIFADKDATKDERLGAKYNRLTLNGKGGIVLPDDFDSDNRIIYYFLAMRPGIDVAFEMDPDAYDDVVEFVSQEMETPAGKEAYKDCKDDKARKELGITRLQAAASALNIDLREVEQRINTALSDAAGVGVVLSDPPDMYDADQALLYGIREERFTSRRQAKLAFGGEGIAVNTGETDETLTRELADGGAVKPVSREQHLFIAGEVPPKQSDLDVPEPVQVADRNIKQPEGSVIPQMFVDDGVLDFLISKNVFPAAQRDAIIARTGASGSDDRALPSFYIEAAGTDADSVKDVMSLLYDTHMMPSKRNEIERLLRHDDFRSLLGWHRGGTAKSLVTFHMQDAYSMTMLSAKNLQPYTLASRDSNDDGEVIAKIRTVTGPNPDDFTHLVAIDTGSRLPTFEFSQKFNPAAFDVNNADNSDYAGRTFDGAGILVINGNLHVKTTFSYYGILIVLGDIIVEPDTGWYYRRDVYGNYLDEDGNRIFMDEDGKWYRLQRMDDGSGNVYDDKVYTGNYGSELKPELTLQYRGELNLQGRLYVGGDTVIKTVTDAEGKEHTGKMSILSSGTALEVIEPTEVDGSEIGRYLLNKAVWTTSANSPVSHIWNDEVEE